MSTIVSSDHRTPQQIQADEEIANNPERFRTDRLLTEEGAIELIEFGEMVHSIRRSIPMDNITIAVGSISQQPFRWKDKVFRVLRAEYTDGKAIVQVTPPDTAFEAELKSRIEKDRFHNLSYYQGFGFICFPDDYKSYQDN